jgi:anaerobic magnesium-protoporphyrin IX monomethyl ester cyclase
MKPDNIDRAELLDGVMANYRRFYMKRMFFQYPWVKDPFRRRYLIGCIKAFLKSAMERKFYQLGKQNYWGPLFKKFIKFDYDKSKTKIVEPDHNAWKKAPPAKRPAQQASGLAAAVKACGGGDQQMEGVQVDIPAIKKPRASMMACGGGGEQLTAEQMKNPQSIKRPAEAVEEA